MEWQIGGLDARAHERGYSTDGCDAFHIGRTNGSSATVLSLGRSFRPMTTTTSKPCPKCGSHERRPRGNCAECHRQAAARYGARKKAAPGSHSKQEWEAKAATYDSCPVCHRSWQIVERPNRQRLPYTKGHIISLAQGGSDDISNIQPECAKCNYARHGAHFRHRT